jgi:hypothetical protein
MSRIISTFEQFKIDSMSPRLNEADGFGTSSFLLRKDSGVFNYFFNIEPEGGGDEMGYHLIVGKYSDAETIEGPKNSYCVLTLNQISHELIDDIAIDKEGIPQPNSMQFKAKGNEVSRIMEYVSKCVLNYLETNPKVTRIYDEILENLELEGSGTYIEFMKSIIISYLGEKWSVQEGSSKKSVIISR